MRAELAAGRQHGKHRAMDRRNRIQQFDRLRAQRARRRQKVVVPFQIKSLPPALEERIETPIVVPGGRPDEALVEQPHRLVADRLPVVAQFCQFRKAVDRDHRLVRNRRARIHQHVVRGEVGRVIAELTADPKSLATAEMHVDRGGGEKIEDNELRREKRSQHFPFLLTPCTQAGTSKSFAGRTSPNETLVRVEFSRLGSAIIRPSFSMLQAHRQDPDPSSACCHRGAPRPPRGAECISDHVKFPSVISRQPSFQKDLEPDSTSSAIITISATSLRDRGNEAFGSPPRRAGSRHFARDKVRLIGI